jgi:hypothetical protein
MLSAATMKFYRCLWGQLRDAKGLKEADRKPLHAHLGLPASSKDFTPEHFDTWKGHVLAQVRPDLDTQIAQIDMPRTRKLVFIGHLLTALERVQEHAELLVRSLRETEGHMRRRRKGDGRMGRSGQTLEQLSLAGLDSVRNALKDECRARWDTKDALLGEIQTVRMDRQIFGSATALEAVREALNLETLPVLNDLDYEHLLVALSTLRRLAGAEVIFAPVASEATSARETADIPF